MDPEETAVDEQAEEPIEEAEPEYDEDGNEIIADAGAAVGEDQPEEPVPAPEPRYVPRVVQPGESPDAALLREGMTPDLYEAMKREMQRDIAHQMQAMQAANIHVTTAAAEHPELFRNYGSRIQQTLSELTPELRSQPNAVNIAIGRIVMEDAPTAGLGATLRKLADMAEGRAPSAPAPKPAKQPIPAEQRPPSPSNRGQATAQPLTRREADIRLIMKDARVSREAAEAMVLGGSV